MHFTRFQKIKQLHFRRICECKRECSEHTSRCLKDAIWKAVSHEELLFEHAVFNGVKRYALICSA